MLNSKKIVVPEKLIKLAKKTPFIPAGIVCAHHHLAMESCKFAFEKGLIQPTFIGKIKLIQKEAEKLNWDIRNFSMINKNSDEEAAYAGSLLASEKKIKILVKGNLHTDTLMKMYLKKEFNLIETRRLSHIWHMTTSANDKPLIITDGALNVAPRTDIKMHILMNAIEFANKIGIIKPKVAVLSGTEDPIESMPSSIEAREIMRRAKNENIDAYVQGPLGFDNAISPKAAAIKNISGEVAGKAEILLVPNLETGNVLSKVMVHFLGACAAGIITGCKVPLVITSRADLIVSRLASIAAANIAAQ